MYVACDTCIDVFGMDLAEGNREGREAVMARMYPEYYGSQSATGNA